MLTLRDRIRLQVQRRIAHGFTFATYHSILGWMKLSRRYRIDDLTRTRAEFRRLIREANGPVLICPNHLTLIDSLIALWALAPAWRYFLKPGLMAWNLPEKRNFHDRGLGLRAVTYLGKCIAIVRQGPSAETQRVLEKVKWLLHRSEAVMIFPEGARSRSGRVDTENFAYGVGKIIQEVPGTRVLCLYLRGRAQDTFSDLPRRGEEFDVRMRMIRPTSGQTGLRGQRDLATQVVQTLAQMETEYFAERRCGHAVA